MFPFSDTQQTKASQAIQFLQVLRYTGDGESFNASSLSDEEEGTKVASLKLLKEYFEQRPKERDDAPALLTLSQIEDYVKERLGEREKVAEQASK